MKRDLENIIIISMMILLLICFMGLSAYLFVGLFDSLTLEEIGTESVPCIDKNNRPFENEMCTKTIICSKLGVAGNEKCDASLGAEE